MHGPTFMANPLACACANAALDLFETEPRLEQVATINAIMTEALEPCRTLPGVRDVRTLGAIGVVELETLGNPDKLRQKLIAHGAWIRPFRNIVYLTPAFTITEADLRSCAAQSIPCWQNKPGLYAGQEGARSGGRVIHPCAGGLFIRLARIDPDSTAIVIFFALPEWCAGL